VGITAGSREVPGRKGLLQEITTTIIIIWKIIIEVIYIEITAIILFPKT